ncbi:hypothetical protein JRQ81_018323 [Phrynocephalus forsythii]|uniref:Domain of unknown function with conserved HDNR motif domain-containing protein n=1 Tax=Phrynocephalus forsythii TaxID=171643 RepID=A0A9Q1B0S7_9SAUR|nr:hypothetical protein JRQ81_018323 [Phrynocephalus forsythii]
MPKGRQANPSTTQDGAWFSHIGSPNISPESLTATMQKQILNQEAARQIDKRLPQMYKVREKKPVNTFPFSVHDNRHCLLNAGEYLDSGLGLRKFQQEVCQHHSKEYFLGREEPIPSDTSHSSVYQTSFVQYPTTEQPLRGRFPKSHVDRGIALKPTTENECLWFSKGYACPNNSAPLKSDRNSKSKQHSPAERMTGIKEDSKENSNLG